MGCKYWTKETFIKTVSESVNISDALRKLNLPYNQGYYNRKFHESLKEFGVDVSHFSKSAIFPKAYDLEKILVKNSSWKGGTNSLKKKLWKSGLLNEECSVCSQKPEWFGKRLSLHMDHINGDPTDNRIENLRILCPNCHSQTETYCGAKKHRVERKIHTCKTCGNQKKTSSPLCSVCSRSSPKEKKIEWPSVEYIKDRLITTSFLQLGKELGVSDNAIRKHLKNR